VKDNLSHAHNPTASTQLRAKILKMHVSKALLPLNLYFGLGEGREGGGLCIFTPSLCNLCNLCNLRRLSRLFLSAL
jgi:hypothetical protein